MSNGLRFYGYWVLLVFAASLLTAGCNKTPVRPELGEYNAVGIRYAPVTTPDGIAQVFAMDRAEKLARKNMRQRIFSNPEVVGLTTDVLDVTIRDNYMDAKLTELLRTEAKVVYTEYSIEERRAEAIIELDAESFAAKYMAAYNRRLALLQ